MRAFTGVPSILTVHTGVGCLPAFSFLVYDITNMPSPPVVFAKFTAPCGWSFLFPPLLRLHIFREVIGSFAPGTRFASGWACTVFSMTLATASALCFCPSRAVLPLCLCEWLLASTYLFYHCLVTSLGSFSFLLFHSSCFHFICPVS